MHHHSLLKYNFIILFLISKMRGNNIHKLCQPLYLPINKKYKRNMKINEFIHAY